MKCSCSIGTKLSPVYKVICVSLLCCMYNVLDIKGVGRGGGWRGYSTYPFWKDIFIQKVSQTFYLGLKRGAQKVLDPKFPILYPPARI